MSFFTAIFGGFDVLIKNTKSFLILASGVSLLSTIIYFVFGQDIFCVNSNYLETHYCGKTMITFAVPRILQGFILVVFMRIWYQCVLTQKQSFSYKMMIPQTTDIKTIGLFLVLLATISVSFVSLYLLYVREPNPNWRIESAYFFFVSLGFVFPVFALRFVSLFAYNLDNEKFPSVKKIWNDTAGLTMKILIGFIFFMLIFSMVTNIIIQYSFSTNNANSSILAFFVEYLSCLVSLSMITVFTNIAYQQKQILSERD